IQIAKILLAKGYSVVGTIRSASEADYIKTLFKTHSANGTLDFAVVEDLTAEGVFDDMLRSKAFDAVVHTSSPSAVIVENPEKDLLLPAIKGTKGILESTHRCAPSVKRVVVTSSFTAILDLYKGNRPGYTYTEKDWSPVTYEQGCTDGRMGYCASKKLAELAAWDFMRDKKPRFTLTTLCPSIVFGPPEQEVTSLTKVNSSLSQIYECFNGTATPENGVWGWADVRDVAMAHVLAIESEAAANQRYLINAGPYSAQQFLDFIWRHYPERAQEKGISKGTPNRLYPEGGCYTLDNSKSLKDLVGLKYQHSFDNIFYRHNPNPSPLPSQRPSLLIVASSKQFNTVKSSTSTAFNTKSMGIADGQDKRTQSPTSSGHSNVVDHLAVGVTDDPGNGHGHTPRRDLNDRGLIKVQPLKQSEMQFYKAVDPGLVNVNICSESLRIVDVKIQIITIGKQTVITRDNVNVEIDSVIYFQITNPYRAAFGISDLRQALTERAQTTLRHVVGARAVQSVVTERDAIALEIEEIVADVADKWGVAIEGILIKDITFSADVAASLSSAAQQKRIGESKVIAARAEVDAARLMRTAADILSSPAAMQIRQLEALQAMAKTASSKVVFVPMQLQSDVVGAMSRAEGTGAASGMNFPAGPSSGGATDMGIASNAGMLTAVSDV
ncbi:hypothetical protein FRB97_005186, partial [Tulasnella sp. 331]